MNSFDIPVEMRRNYLERRLLELEHMKGADDLVLCERAKTMGHQIKGNADSFGFPELTPNGIALENAGKNLNSAEVRTVLERIKLQVEAMLQQLHSQ